MFVASCLSTSSNVGIPSPIAILPKVLQQPSQSKIKLNALSQTSDTACTTSCSPPPREGPFAHNYVIHHLQDDTQMKTGECSGDKYLFWF